MRPLKCLCCPTQYSKQLQLPLHLPYGKLSAVSTLLCSTKISWLWLMSWCISLHVSNFHTFPGGLITCEFSVISSTNIFSFLLQRNRRGRTLGVRELTFYENIFSHIFIFLQSDITTSPRMETYWHSAALCSSSRTLPVLCFPWFVCWHSLCYINRGITP